MHNLFMLSQIDHDALMNIRSFREESDFLRERLASKCPDVKWNVYDSTLGGYDVVNLLRADDYHQLMKAWAFIQSFRGMKTQTVFATRWEEAENVFMGLADSRTLGEAEGACQSRPDPISPASEYR